MANDVYTPTTESNPKSSFFRVPSELLDKPRCCLKILEVLLSLVAFVLEETVSTCLRCSPLYFFEFVSCTAFLFTCLLLILLTTRLHQRVGISCWPKVDFIYTSIIALLFLISSIVFGAENSKTSVEIVAVVFGILSCFVFVVDLVFFYRTNGFPFKKDQNPEARNGVPAQAEQQRLNTPVNTAD
ncbi:CKLF-like MARVEL transmembrane domain-containing protein 6 [Austrofundulus limnaeus]|uniref:CKLF-like MARVEL transmembrane domain-containing protein 6 n=1 Tax=Austrofundulus limnaeus TaxID=52670 RepID=A0A2I4CXZ1_AUSLI|nr:PREDICTED: CKLF-like MARVEL transmembrane domain-containing protein 6 [Austrofundulus limnaeus]